MRFTYGKEIFWNVRLTRKETSKMASPEEGASSCDTPRVREAFMFEKQVLRTQEIEVAGQLKQVEVTYYLPVRGEKKWDSKHSHPQASSST